MSESREIGHEVLQDEIQDVIYSIVDKIHHNNENRPNETKNRLDVINQCKKDKEGEENNLSIVSDSEVLTRKDVLDNPDHNDYCSKNTTMEDNTKTEDSDLKCDDSRQDSLKVVSENVEDKEASSKEDFSIISSQNVSSPDSTLQGKSKSNKTLTPKIVAITPRATRSSQNPDFAAKHRKFLTSKLMKRDFDSDSSETFTGSTLKNKSYVSKDLTQRNKPQDNSKDNTSDTKVVEKRKREVVPSKVSESDDVEVDDPSNKKRKNSRNENYQPTVIEGEGDCYCWRCHRDGNIIPCETCPRVYHLRCIQLESVPSRGWVCPECSTVMHAENTDSRTRAMRMLTLDQLCKLLQFAVNRMKAYEGSEEFSKPVDTQQFEHYRKFIVKPMDLSLLEENIKNNLYGSTEAFLADAKWILHNCVIFNTVQSKFTNVARALLKICRQEMLEIENCPDCYQNAHTRSSDSWFIEVCRKPHVLVWAKLKGFPFWPAKAMSTNNENQVDVRFFGAHDRAWVPVNACYLYSKMPPAQSAKKKNNLEECIQELEAHIKKLRDKFGKFEHAPYKTIYNPKKEDEQLSLLLPNFDAKISNAKKVGRLIHDRVRPQSASSTPEKKEQISDLKKEKPESQKKKLDQRKSVEKQSKEKKRKAKSHPTPSRGPKVKYLGQVDEVDKKESSGSMMVDIDKQLDDDVDMLSPNNDEYNSSSPPKFFITKLGLQKTNVNVLSSSSNETKIAFVDKLQEKLSQLDSVNNELELDKNKNQESSSEENSEKTSDSELKSSPVGENKKKEVDKYAEITIIKSVVVLHDLKNSKVLNGRLKNFVKLESDSEVESNEDNLGEKSNEITTDVTNPTDEVDIIQIDSGPSSVGSNENADDEREKTVNKKKNNINNVVQTIKERKSSTDVKTSDKSVEKDNSLTVNTVTVDKDIIKNVEKNFDKEKQSVPSENTELTDTIVTSKLNLSNDENEVSSTRPVAEKVMLDDSEYPLVIIDEPAEDNMSSSSSVREIPISGKDSNKILKSFLENIDKPAVDKNRRKGKPAKVCSRESVDSQESNESTRRISVEGDDFKKTVVGNVLDEVSGIFTNNCKSLIDAHISGVIDEVSGKYTRTQNSSEESNVTINVLSDESMLNRKSPKEIRASVNLSKDVSLSVLGDITPSTLDMECISDSEEPVLLNEIIPNEQQQIRPTARKTLPKPTNTQMISVTKNINKPSPPPQRKSVELTEGIKVCSPQSLQNVMSPPLLTTNELNKSIPQVHNGHPPIQMMPSRNVPTPRILPPLHKPSGLMGPGPLNVHLDRLAQKLSGRFRIMFEEILKEMSLEGCTEATIKGLQLEMERMQWRHRQEMAELKHNTDLVVMEVRASLESEKQRILIEAKHKFEQEKEMVVQETKRKQWCAYCYKEALLYCCWNTAYCSYPCQQSHWLQHMAVCSQSEVPARNDNPKQIVRGNTGPGVLSNSAKAFSMQNQPQMHDVKRDYDFEDINNYSHLGHIFDNNNNEDTLIRTKAPRRKRCGECKGCSLVENCQSCRACLNQRSHQVCQKRRCSNIIYHRAANKKRHAGPNSNNMKHGVGDGFMPHNVPIMNNGIRNMGPRHFAHGPPHHFMPIVHHQPPPPGSYHHLPPTDQVFPHPVFMN